MEITIKLENLCILIAGSATLLLAIIVGICLLLRKEGNRLSNVLLSLLVILSALTLLNDLLATTGIYHRFQYLYFIPIYYTLSIGPLAWLYVKSKLQPGIVVAFPLHYLHLVLPLTQALVYFSVGFRGEAFKDYLWAQPFFRTYLDAEALLFPCSLLYYFVLSKRALFGQSSPPEHWAAKLHKWLTQFVGIIGFIACVEFAFVMLQGLFSFSSRPIPDFIAYVHQLFIACFVFFLSMKVYQQIFPEKIIDRPAETAADTNNKQALSPAEIKGWSEKISYIFGEQKLYRNPDLNIEMLSKELALPVRLTSYILNQGLEQNFTQLLNSYRTAEVVERLSTGEHKKVTILSIAFDAGFESKSTFYRNFKTLTGLTPSEYISRLESPEKRPS